MFLKTGFVATITIGPFLDKTDGVTAETGLGNVPIEVSKNGAAFVARNSATVVAHDAEGWYRVELSATDTGTNGQLVVKAQDSATHLPVWATYTCMDPQRFTSLITGVSELDINVKSMDTNVLDTLALDASAVLEIADGVWDEARAGHTAGGSFGEGIASVQGNVTGTAASVTGAVGSVTGAVGSVTGNVGGNVAGSTASVTGAVGSVTGNVGGSAASVTGAVGSVTGNVGGNVVGTVASVVGNVGGNVVGSVGSLSVALLNKVADHVLRRSFATAAGSGDGDVKSFRSLLGAVAKQVNKVAIVASTLSVFEADDTTPLGTQAVTATPGADPISAVDTV